MKSAVNVAAAFRPADWERTALLQSGLCVNAHIGSRLGTELQIVSPVGVCTCALRASERDVFRLRF